jgi:ribosomal protein L11 methyltransferase
MCAVSLNAWLETLCVTPVNTTMYELRLSVPGECADEVCDALMSDELAALSVSVEDADAQTEHESPIFGEPGMPTAQVWNRSVIQALFSTEEQATQALTWLMAQVGLAGDLQLQSLQAIEDQDWVRLTQSQFQPVEITPGFWVVPSWHAVPEGAQKVIHLDPGMAFGTGTHPTTRMCMRFIAQASQAQNACATSSWQRVLDYGCGSGILAITAGLFGAQGIEAVDIDPDAVKATARNAQANHVALSCGLPDLAHGVYPLVLANILATPLKLLAPLLCAHLDVGGHLVLAGILERQAEELQEAYAPWLKLQVSDACEGWILMTGLRHEPQQKQP